MECAAMSPAGLPNLRKALLACIAHFRSLETVVHAIRFIWEHPDPSGLNIAEINRLAASLNRGVVFRVEEGADGVRELRINHPADDCPAVFSVRNPGMIPVSFSEYARQVAESNLGAWLDLTAIPTIARKTRTVRRDKPTEARDKWIYEQCCKGVAHDTIAIRLKKKPTTWVRITRKQGIFACAKRYAERHALPLPPPRQSRD
jgi:hypothetical protein